MCVYLQIRVARGVCPSDRMSRLQSLDRIIVNVASTTGTASRVCPFKSQRRGGAGAGGEARRPAKGILMMEIGVRALLMECHDNVRNEI